MKKISFILFWGLLTFTAYAQPANDNCASAIALTIDAGLSCGQSATGATLQGGECITNYAGITESTMWYQFDATNDSLVLNFVVTNSPAGPPEVSVYGPFAPGGGCIPACASTVYNGLQNGDPGSHILLTGLATSGNNHYLIQIQNNQPGGPGSAVGFCINLQNPEGNNTAATGDLLNACGTAFTNSTNGGYWQAGTSIGFNSFDGNAATTCGTCGEVGDDSPFVINNVSWTYFCSLTAGTWQITVNGVSGCTLAAPNQGVQASVFTGTPTALINQGNSQNPIPPGGSWTSGVLTVNSGECAYLMIDGFAGDACNYNVTLTNLTGGCIVLPIELGRFSANVSGNSVILSWSTLSEKNNSHFTIERSDDAANYEYVGTVIGSIKSETKIDYDLIDVNPLDGINYYRLSQTDLDGKTTVSGITSVNFQLRDESQLSVFPNPTENGSNPTIQISGRVFENYTVTISDITGKSISVIPVSLNDQGKFELRIQEALKPGLYFIGISGEYGKKLVQKLIVK